MVEFDISSSSFPVDFLKAILWHSEILFRVISFMLLDRI